MVIIKSGKNIFSEKSNRKTFDKTKFDSLGRKRRKIFFDKHISIRLSKDITNLMTYWISHPQLRDSFGKPLYVNQSHFVKCALIKLFKELKEEYGEINTVPFK